MGKICHMLIGSPASGKSTIAQLILASDPDSRIVSSDRIRKKLFGDEEFQGSWAAIEAEIFSEIASHIAAGHSIIYDATNAVRSWRIDFLNQVQKYTNFHWIAWYLTTPLSVCQQWNQQRNRQVPDSIISQMYAYLQEYPPQINEGFATIYRIKYHQERLDININQVRQVIDDLKTG